MKKLKIAFFETTQEEETYFSKKLKSHSLLFFKEPIRESHLKKIKNIDILSIFIYSKIEGQVINQLPLLKSIITRSSGYDHIDLSACKDRNISVLRVPAYGINSVAEHTFALILSLSRKIHNSYVRTHKGDFSLHNLQGFDLAGKTIGIIGLGKIGKKVAQIAQGFSMNILAYDSYKDSAFAKKFNINYVDLNNLLKNSDIVSLHCNYTESAHHMIDIAAIKLMKKEAIIINTARGGLIDTKALLNAIKEKRIGGAGLDVLENEKLIKEEGLKNQDDSDFRNTLIRLSDRENVIITPHNAFNSKESVGHILSSTFDNIRCVINHKPCENKIL